MRKASGNTWANQVDLPVPRGPKRKKLWAGGCGNRRTTAFSAAEGFFIAILPRLSWMTPCRHPKFPSALSRLIWQGQAILCSIAGRVAVPGDEEERVFIVGRESIQQCGSAQQFLSAIGAAVLAAELPRG